MLLIGPQTDGEKGYREGPHQHSVFDLQYSRNAKGDHNWVTEGEGNFVLNPTLLQPQQVWLQEPTLLSCCKMSMARGKVSTKVGVRNRSCAPIAMVSMLHLPKIARSGRRKRKFSVPELKNTSPLRKPDS